MKPSPAKHDPERMHRTTLAPKGLENTKPKRINIGCGQTPTPRWLNYDNSLSLLLARHPFVSFFLERIGLLKPDPKSFISTARKKGILWADATKNIPLPDNFAQVIYTSHMLQQLSRIEAKLFLREAYRVLEVGGIIRIAVPDLQKMIEQYMAHGDADSFVEHTLLGREKPISLIDRLKYLLVGHRNHSLWMYDESSLCQLLVESGFRNPCVLEPGTTTISESDALNLYERASQSIYVEASK